MRNVIGEPEHTILLLLRVEPYVGTPCPTCSARRAGPEGIHAHIEAFTTKK